MRERVHLTCSWRQFVCSHCSLSRWSQRKKWKRVQKVGEMASSRVLLFMCNSYSMASEMQQRFGVQHTASNCQGWMNTTVSVGMLRDSVALWVLWCTNIVWGPKTNGSWLLCCIRLATWSWWLQSNVQWGQCQGDLRRVLRQGMFCGQCRPHI